MSVEAEFFDRVSNHAAQVLSARLGTHAGKKAAHAVAMAMVSAVRTARNPEAFLRVTDASVIDVINTVYETQLYPGGPNPVAYLVPQAPRSGAAPELQFRITHRGLTTLSSRADIMVITVPVHTADSLSVEFGEVAHHVANPTVWASTLAELAGVIVVVRRVRDGVTLGRFWTPRALIEARRDKSRDKSVWSEWPVEMAQKTAIKWAFARGMVPLDSPEMRAALEADSRGEIPDHEPVMIESAPTGRRALGLGAPAGTVPFPKVVDAEPVPVERTEAPAYTLTTAQTKCRASLDELGLDSRDTVPDRAAHEWTTADLRALSAAIATRRAELAKAAAPTATDMDGL